MKKGPTSGHANDPMIGTRYWSEIIRNDRKCGLPPVPSSSAMAARWLRAAPCCTWISRRLFTWSMLSKWFFMPQTSPQPTGPSCKVVARLRPSWDRHIWWPHVSLTWSIGPGDAPMRTGIVLWISPNFSELVSFGFSNGAGVPGKISACRCDTGNASAKDKLQSVRSHLSCFGTSPKCLRLLKSGHRYGAGKTRCLHVSLKETAG